jgi:hypothetical protein
MKRSTKKRIKEKIKIWYSLVYSKVFKNYLENGEFNLDEICRGIIEVSSVIRCLCREEKRISYVGYKIPNPYESYGYKNLEKIKSDLRYISDRFYDPKRLLWLLYVPSEVARLKREATV